MPDQMNNVPAQRVSELLADYQGTDIHLADMLCDKHDPDSIAYHIVSPGGEIDDLTYGALRSESEQFAAALSSMGIRPGDRVATLMGKSRRYLVTLLGIWRLGAVHVPLFTAFAPPAIAFRLTGSGAKLVVTDQTQEPKLAPGEDIPNNAPWQVITAPVSKTGFLSFDEVTTNNYPAVSAARLPADSPMIQIYTSGTTGTPKGVVLPIRALASFQAYMEFGLGLTTDDVFWNAADPGWAYGLYYAILGPLVSGTRSVLLEGGFVPDTTMTVLSKLGVTSFAAAPTVFRSLRSSGVTIPEGLNLRCASSAGEPLTPDINIWAREALGIDVHDHYGQTELGMIINNHHLPSLQRPIKPGSMGHAMPGWSVDILHESRDETIGTNQVGRVAVDINNSPLFWFDGYHNDPAKSAEKFSADGRWYLTGDVGVKSEDGYFSFSSRDDDVIIMAGYRIGPFEIESVVNLHPAVVESAVIAVPDEVRGEVMECFVVVANGIDATPELAVELQQWVKKRYAAHAYPRSIHFVDGLPKTPSGKVQRYILKQQRREELNAE